MSVKSVKKVALVLTGMLMAQAAVADDTWSFSNVSANYLDWSEGTQERTAKGAFGGKKDFPFLELEGAIGNKTGELYGFFDLENPTHNTRHENGRERRIASKVVGRYNLTQGANPVQAYAHVYDFRESGFHDQNRVLGLGTQLNVGKVWVKPFVGWHQEMKTDVGAHMNGGMAGYVAGYNFDVAQQKMMVTQWHESEFARKDKYLVVGNSQSGGVTLAKRSANNGAVSLWWMPSKSVTTGVTYRYADQKLGTNAYQNAWIWSAKYNF